MNWGSIYIDSINIDRFLIAEGHLTYFDIHTLFMVIPTAAFFRHWRRQADAMPTMRGLGGILLLALLASIWTMPWDNLMVLWGVWTYPDDVVLGKVFYIPIEEQLFFVIQPLFTGMWFLMLYPRGLHRPGRESALTTRLISFLFALVLGLFAYTQCSSPTWLYLGSFIAWFSIPIAIQWGFGSHLLLGWWRQIILGTIPPTLYLCILDSFAIDHRVWSISSEHVVGLYVGALPIEEVIFFLFTNLLVIQGLALLYEILERRSLTINREAALLSI